MKNLTMNNLDWGKTTEERNANLEKFEALLTPEEKESFKLLLKQQPETLKRYNGNGQPYETGLPELFILCQHGFNDTALDHLRKNTGIDFRRKGTNLTGQPTSSNQIGLLFVTYNFKTQYHNNLTSKNTLYLKVCNGEGFKVEAICPDCAKHNNIHWPDAKLNQHLSV
jgi:hypothetical protein